MNKSFFDLQQSRTNLANKLEVFNAETECILDDIQKLPEWERNENLVRLQTLEALAEAIVDYDSKVQTYVRFHPEQNNTQYLQDQLWRCKRYIQSLGGDWSTIVWGKNSDYR